MGREKHNRIEERCVCRRDYVKEEVVWRIYGECNFIKIDVTMHRDVCLCRRDMYVCKERM